jgi:hypothetical protein
MRYEVSNNELSGVIETLPKAGASCNSERLTKRRHAQCNISVSVGQIAQSNRGAGDRVA